MQQEEQVGFGPFRGQDASSTLVDHSAVQRAVKRNDLDLTRADRHRNGSAVYHEEMDTKPTQSSANESASPSAVCRCGYSLFRDQKCPECGRSFAEATKPKPASVLWGLSVAALCAAMFVNCGLRCMCGHLDAFALIFTTLTAAAAWTPFLFARESRLTQRAVMMIAVILATLLWFDNVCDVLWSGHDPLL